MKRRSFGKNHRKRKKQKHRDHEKIIDEICRNPHILKELQDKENVKIIPRAKLLNHEEDILCIYPEGNGKYCFLIIEVKAFPYGKSAKEFQKNMHWFYYNRMIKKDYQRAVISQYSKEIPDIKSIRFDILIVSRSIENPCELDEFRPYWLEREASFKS